MLVKDLSRYIFDKVEIYKDSNQGFETLFHGEFKDIQLKILELEVRDIGAKRKGIVDICVY